MAKETLENRLVNKFSEFETKYEVEEVHLEKFGTTLQESKRHFEVNQYDGRDDFYIKDGDWIRHRCSNDDQELTLKRKVNDGISHRIELNLNVGNTDEEVVSKFLNILSYKYSFTIFKISLVYNFADAAIAFYKVFSDRHKKPRCFIEIEVYNNIKGLDENKSWKIIRKYEKMLHDIGVTSEDRLNKSLYDMYKPEVSHDLVKST